VVKSAIERPPPRHITKSKKEEESHCPQKQKKTKKIKNKKS